MLEYDGERASGRESRARMAAELITEALSWKMIRRRAVATVADTVERLREGLASIDRGAFPGVSDAAWRVVTDRVATLRDELGGEVGSARAPRRRLARRDQPREPGGKPGGRGSLGAPTDSGPVAVPRTR